MIALIAAMSQESNALLRYIKGWKRGELGEFSCKVFEVNGQECLLVTSGMGVRRASEATKELIRVYSPRKLISFGIAGAVEAELEIGDVVVCEAWCRQDNGTRSPLTPLTPWPDNAIKAAAFSVTEHRAHLVTGTAITTQGSTVAEEQVRDLKHPILEMETAGIAQIAADKGIPLLSIRAISDGPRAPIPFNLAEIMDSDANYRAGALGMAIIRHPRIVLQFRRLIRNTNIAADNAAYAVISALSSKDI